MKTIFRFLTLAMLLTAFSFAAVTTSYAQDPAAEKKALYDTHIANYASTDPAKLQIALDAAKSYVQKFPEDKEQVTYYTAEVTRIEKAMADIKVAEGNKLKNAERGKLLARFDTALKANNNQGNPAEVYSAGKEIVGLNDDLQLDVLLVLGTVGFDQASGKTPNNTYNEDTINYAKQAIQKLEANGVSKTGDYGVLQYAYKNKENADGKNNALNWMNYNIGWIMYYGQGKDNPAKKKEALPYFYKATKYTSLNQKNPTPYQAIGAWYLDEAIRIDKERTAKLTANGNKDNEETLAMVGEQKGYADRAIDAYSRAYKLAKANPKTDKAYTDNLYSRLTELYKFRYDGKVEGIDAFVAKVDTTPFADPTTPITPVKIESTEPTAAPSTTGTTTVPTTDTTKPATGTTAKPATGTTTKPAVTPKPATTPTTGATKPAGTATTDAATTDSKTAVKKPAPKKKGTR